MSVSAQGNEWVGGLIMMLLAIFVMWLGGVWGILPTIVIKKLKILKTGVIKEKVRLHGKKLVSVILLRIFNGVMVFVMYIATPILIMNVIGLIIGHVDRELVSSEQFLADRFHSMSMIFIAIGVYCVATALIVLAQRWIRKLKRQSVE